LSNYYILLGISPRATEEQVRQAYLKLAKIYHPDKNSSPDATKKMSEINLAYETLRDSNRRKKYDQANNIDSINGTQEEDSAHSVSCPVCGFKPRIGDRFCAQCGTSFSHGRCVQCNFINNSGTFVCLTCGYIFRPQANLYEKTQKDDVSYEEPDGNANQILGDDLSEIIRCPQCNEINVFSRGWCWHCGLHFEIDEAA
jgi:curved DNA-binding protein CbpA